MISWDREGGAAKAELLRSGGQDRGLVDYKVAALDEIWSGLRFARRT